MLDLYASPTCVLDDVSVTYKPMEAVMSSQLSVDGTSFGQTEQTNEKSEEIFVSDVLLQAI